MPNFDLVDPATAKLSAAQARAIGEITDGMAVSSDPEHARRMTGKALIVLNEVCKIPLAQAWRIVRPNSKSVGHAAEVQAARWVKHHKSKYPLTITEAMEVTGVTIEGLIQRCRDMLHATKAAWNNDTGTFVQTDIPDWPSVNAALTQIRHFIDLDKRVREEAVLGAGERAVEMPLPTAESTLQEWEDFYRDNEADVLAERTRAAEEMKLIAEGQRALREGADRKPDPTTRGEDLSDPYDE